MPRRKRKRIILWALALLPLLPLSLPLWLPWVLRPIARRAGVTYSRYERSGYQRFVLERITLTNGATRISVGRMEALVPTVWLWRHFISAKSTETVFQAQNWKFESLPTSGPPSPIYSQVRDIEKVCRIIQSWMPVAVLSNGTVEVQETSVHVPFVSLTNGQLRAQVVPARDRNATLAANLAKAPYEIDLASDASRLQCQLRISTTTSALSLDGTGLWWSNRFRLDARFGTNDILPLTANLEAQQFHFPAKLLCLRDYREISGTLNANWKTSQFEFNLDARAQPAPDMTNFQPLQLAVHAQGDINRANVQSFTITSPSLKVRLSRNVVLNFRGSLLREAAVFSLNADLSKQHWFPFDGQFHGEAQLLPGEGRFPQAHFHLSGSEIGYRELRAATARLDGGLNWPWLELTEAKAGFTDGSTASAAAKLELETNYVAEGHFQFSGPLIRRWLPHGYSVRGTSVSARFRGPLDRLNHSGHLEVTNFESAQLAPVQLRADWNGDGLELSAAKINILVSNAVLLAQGALLPRGTHTSFRLDSLSVSTNGAPALTLKRPLQASFEQGQSSGWKLDTSPLHCMGPGGNIEALVSLNWPREGLISLSMQQLSSKLCQPWAKRELPPLELRKFDGWARWTNGPVNFGLFLSTTGATPTDGTTPSVPVSAEAALGGGLDGITLSNLTLTVQTSAVAVAHGFLPATIHPGAVQMLELDVHKSLDFHATAQPHAFFWATLANWSGLNLVEPELQVNVFGTWSAPRGKAMLHAQQIQTSRSTRTIPTLENLQLLLEMDGQRARLTQGRLLVEGQAVSFTGEIPLGETFWSRLKEQKLPDWTLASGHVRITDAELAPFDKFLPNPLAPEGELNVDLSVSPGPKLNGSILLRGARTRPLEDIGPFRNMELQLKLQDNTARLERAAARLGGADVILSGVADLSGTAWLTGKLPPFSIVLHGENVPLSRQPQSIIRSDLLLAVTKTNETPPLISGVARLRDSYYLSDIVDLIPGKVTTPSQRPPYFSIDTPGLADWRLGLRVEGSHFLKVNGSLFGGEVSANLQLQGTLKDPIALGELRIDSGAVRFPFASLQVQQGLVNLTSQDPYHPQLFVNATSKQFGYDIKMEVTGPVDAPALQFTSNPPLSSQQILLMITAGELPKGESSLTAQQKAQTAALFLGRDVLSKIGWGDQAEQRITIRSGEEISEQGRPTYHVEFKLNDDWSLVGEYDRFGDFNAGVKWRVYSK